MSAKSCSSVDGHHVFETRWGFGRLNVVLRSPQRLVLSSSGTTSSGQNGASAGWTWCFTPPNALFFRRRAPRLWNKIGFGRLGVVLRSPQCLVLSSPGTTSLGLNRASAGWTWCFTPRNALFFRRRAPRQHAYLNEKPESKKKSQFQLTLMKGDDVVEMVKVTGYELLLFY